MQVYNLPLQRLGQLAALLLVLVSTSAVRAQNVETIRDWKPGDPPPLGYHVARKHTVGIVGGSVLAGGYALSLVSALALSTGCYLPAGGRSDSTCHEPEAGAAPLLLVPVAGPFLTFSNDSVRHDGGALFWFSFFGAAQVTGAALLVYDLAVPHYGLKRGESRARGHVGPTPRWLVAPIYLGSGPGLALLGQL